MENSQDDAKIFSVRIVSMDYYMASPIPDLDICYSSFQGNESNLQTTSFELLWFLQSWSWSLLGW